MVPSLCDGDMGSAELWFDVPDNTHHMDSISEVPTSPMIYPDNVDERVPEMVIVPNMEMDVDDTTAELDYILAAHSPDPDSTLLVNFESQPEIPARAEAEDKVVEITHQVPTHHHYHHRQSTVGEEDTSASSPTPAPTAATPPRRRRSASARKKAATTLPCAATPPRAKPTKAKAGKAAKGATKAKKTTKRKTKPETTQRVRKRDGNRRAAKKFREKQKTHEAILLESVDRLEGEQALYMAQLTLVYEIIAQRRN